MTGGWIGIDLDGTLATYDGWKGIEHIGEPVAVMAQRVREWQQEGRAMKIFTARVAVPEPERTAVIAVIHDWLQRHDLPTLDVTNVKDLGMIELWDDRAIQVLFNTGLRADQPVQRPSNVVTLPVITTLPLDPDRVLNGAVGKLSSAIIIGTTSDGQEWFAASEPNGADVLWAMERAKLKLLRIVDGD